jgi:hypothetical protein
MRSGYEALEVAMSRATIPFTFIGTDRVSRNVTDLMCMRAVLANFDLIPISGFPTANAGWQISQGKHYDRTPPAGAVVWFPNPRSGSSGHVAIATGNGDEAWTTPVYLKESGRYTRSHTASIAKIEQLCGNAYAGWTDHLGNHKIVLASFAGGGTKIIEKEESEAMVSITRIVRKGVGEFIMYASPTTVSLTRELSTAKPEDRAFEEGIAATIARAAGLGDSYKIPLIDDSPNGAWYLRDRIAGRIAGMPNGFPLSPTNPYTPRPKSSGGDVDVNEIIRGVIAGLPAKFSGTFQS